MLAREREVVAFVEKCLQEGRTFITTDIVEAIKERFTARDYSTKLYLFDNWSYIGAEGAHARVVQLLEEGFSHTNYHIYDGDSRATLPRFFIENSGVIDLVYVDGDHTWEGAWNDLNAVHGHFKTLVVHDLYHPQHSYLYRVFKQYVVSHDYPYFIVGRKRSGIGVAFDLSS